MHAMRRYYIAFTMHSSEALPSRNLRQHWVLLAFLAVLTLLTYASTFIFGFVYDDHTLIENAKYYTDWGWLPEYFKHPFALNYYRPLVMIWFLLNRMAFDLNPVFWHIAVVLVHVAVTLLAYAAGYLLTRSVGIAGLAAAIFAVHPVHVESVAWISGVPDPLLAVCVFIAVICYLRFREVRGLGWKAGSILAAAAAMLSKEVGIAIPLLIGAHAMVYSSDAWTARLRSAFLCAVPTGLVAAAYLVVRTYVLTGVAHVVGVDAWHMVANWPRVAVFYIQHLVWPTRLSILYDLKANEPPSWANLAVPSVVLFAIVPVLWYLARFIDRRLLSFALIWAAVCIAPAFYLRAFNVGDIVHDRYLYLSVFGFALIIAAVVERLASLAQGVGLRSPSLLAGVLIVSLLAGSSLAEQVHYTDDLRLFYRSVHIAPRSETAWIQLGWQLRKAKRYDESYAAYKNAIAINDSFWLAHANLGYMLLEIGQIEEAEKELTRALAINPGYLNAQMHLALVRARKGELRDAMEIIDRAVHVAPDNPELHYARAYILQQMKEPAKERQELQTVLRLAPEHVAARERLHELKAK
jgi:tetratricopeptide (TPR) repeat protein